MPWSRAVGTGDRCDSTLIVKRKVTVSLDIGTGSARLERVIFFVVAQLDIFREQR